MVVGAYVLARGVESPPVAQASTETALLEAIATKDSSGDGLPDWEKVLYGIPIEATTTDYFHLGMTDGEAVARGLIVPKAIANIPDTVGSTTNTGTTSSVSTGAGTLTNAFAKSFFALYLAAKQANNGVNLSSEQTAALANQALNQLSQTVVPAPDFKKISDMTVSGTGPDALRAFAVAAEAVLKKNKNDATMSEIGYLQAAVQGGDTTAPQHLVSLAKAYRDSAFGIAMLPVPEELAATDLAIVNALMRLSEIDADFARVGTDPLSAILALEQYPQAELAAEHAFANLATTYRAAGVVLIDGTPGAAFVNIMANITAREQGESQTP